MSWDRVVPFFQSVTSGAVFAFTVRQCSRSKRWSCCRQLKTRTMMRKLFSANPACIGRFDGPPTSDAVPASLVDGTPGDLKADLIALLGKANVLHRAIDLVRYASDASPYRLVPQVVVLPRTTDDIIKLFRYCRETGRHATFRAAGTSLNGQSQSDDILIDVRRHWYGAKVEDDWSI
jgi:D-lactate dehydrogenase